MSSKYSSAVALVALLGIMIVGLPQTIRADALSKDSFTCGVTGGKLGAKCLVKAAKLLAEVVDPDVETALTSLTDLTDPLVQKKCTAAAAEPLGYSSLGDVTARVNQACEDFAFELNALVFRADQVGLTDSELKCRSTIYKRAQKLRKVVTVQWGKKCIVGDWKGKGCDRTKRDLKIEKLQAKTEAGLAKSCGADFDAVLTSPGATLEERIGAFVGQVTIRGEHYAQRVYPPDLLGPTAAFGPAPVGVLTLDLVDVARLNVAGDGPRPVTVEVYYPSTASAIDGVPRDVVTVLGIPIVETPAYRDVDIAPGTVPLVVFSHGNNGVRFQSFFFAAHLASYGYIVVTPDHHGNTFVDTLASVVDPMPEINRPLDMTFVIDEFLAFNAVASGDFFEGAIDPASIGASGHSFGGLTSLLLAGGDAGFGTFTDTRVQAIFPQAPAAPFATTFFESITIPTLIVGGTIDETTPFATQQQVPYDSMLSGALVVALAELDQAGHFSFSDFCEVSGDLLTFLGGAEEACEPRHLPWRYAQDITKYLALNFFDATLKADAEALARLEPAVLAGFDNVRFESK